MALQCKKRWLPVVFWRSCCEARSYRCRRGCEQRVAWQMQIYAPIWRARLKNAAHRSGFSRDSSSRRGRLEEAMERLKQRSGPAPPEDGPFPGCPARLPRAMKETGRSAASRPREPSRGPGRGAKGPQGHVNSGPTLASATPKRPARGPHYRALPRSEPDTDARRSGRRHKDERPRAATASQRTGAAPACVTSDQRCHPAPSLARWA